MAKAEYRSAIRSRKLINMALAELLQEKQLDKITVTDVVRRADISRGTFYAHYTDIPDVIRHAIDETFSHIRENVFEGSKDRMEIPHALLVQIQQMLEVDMDFYRKVLTSNASIHIEEQLVALVLDFLFQHEDEFGIGDHHQYVLKMRFCAGGLISLYRDWFFGKIDLSLNGLTQKAESLLLKVVKEDNITEIP